MSYLMTNGFLRGLGNISNDVPRADNVDQYRRKESQVDQRSAEACVWK